MNVRSKQHILRTQVKTCRNMKFAIVFFIEENDSVGVVPTNWIVLGKRICMFPPTQSEPEKNLLASQRAPPMRNWLECPIKLYNYYTSYEEALGFISEAENESHIESDFELIRQRFLENASGKEESCNFEPSYPVPPPKQNKKISDYFPVKRSSQALSLTQLEERGSKKNKTDDTEEEEEESCNFEPYPVPPPKQNKNYFPVKRSSQALSLTQLEERRSKKNKTDETGYDGQSSTKFIGPQTTNSLKSMLEEVLKGQEKILFQLKHNEQLHRTSTSSLQRLETKVDSLIATSSTPREETQNLEILQYLPLNCEEFLILDEKLNNSDSLRQQLKKVLLGCYGRDCRGFINCCLRRSLKDEVGLQYSLTGKNKHGGEKIPFQTTNFYNIIREISLTSFEGTKDNVVRDAISDWLLQAKFRIARREKNN